MAWRSGSAPAPTSGPSPVTRYPVDQDRMAGLPQAPGPLQAPGTIPPSGPISSHGTMPPNGSVTPQDLSAEQPEWAVPASGESATPPRRAGAIGDRARRALLRKRRRFYLLAGGVAAVVAAILATVLLTRDNSQSANLPGDLVTTFQPGELQQVPDACHAIPAATIAQYLPGKTKVSAPLPVDGKLGSGCNWALDQPPVYRLLELNLLAYSPSGLASGNGSATNAAMDAYQAALHRLQQPPQGSPAANVTVLNGLGSEAFSAMQVFKAGNATTDVATVTFRYHNVLVSATIDGLIAHNAKGSYGPVDKTQLADAVLAVAQMAAAALH